MSRIFDPNIGRYIEDGTVMGVPGERQTYGQPSKGLRGTILSEAGRTASEQRRPAILGEVGAGIVGATAGFAAGQVAKKSGILDIDIPYVDIDWSAIIPGGDPFISRETDLPAVPGGVIRVLREWSTGTANFMILTDGFGKLHHFVTKRVGDSLYWKEYTPKHPIVIGKELNSRNLKKAAKVFARYKGVHKDIHKIFPHKKR